MTVITFPRQPHTAALSRPPDDPDLAPHDRLRNIADTLAAMFGAGEFNPTRDDTRRMMEKLPLDLMDIAGQVWEGNGR